MRLHNSNWFETIVSYNATQENGSMKKVSETYVVDALTFTEAEAAITNNLTPYLEGDAEFTIKNINPAAYSSVCLSDNDEDNRYFKAKISVTYMNDAGKEKKSSNTYLIQARNLRLAYEVAAQLVNNDPSGNSELEALTKTKIIDVYLHDEQ